MKTNCCILYWHDNDLTKKFFFNDYFKQMKVICTKLIGQNFQHRLKILITLLIQWHVICELLVQLNVVYATICELLVGIYRGMWLMLQHTMFYNIKSLPWTDNTNASMILAVRVLAFCIVRFCLYCLISFFVICVFGLFSRFLLTFM